MDEIALEMKERMGKSIESLKGELNTLRTGRASPAMLDRIECDYYGDKIAINQISSISVPEPRQLLIKPYDRGDIKAIAAAINASNIGINPIVDADCIRLVIPALTEETRRDLVKRAKATTENAKIAIRNIRREYVDLVKESDEFTEDYQKRVQDDIQKAVDDVMKEVDAILAEKEKDIMAI